MTLVHRLRDSICDVFGEVGALAPTNCDGWRAQDLAAHLWLREHRLDALLGIGISRFADRTARLQQEALHRRGFEGIVSELRRPSGPAAFPVAATPEFTIHHIDVGRPNGIEFELTVDDQVQLWRVAALMARRAARAFGGRVAITSELGHRLELGSGNRPVHLRGTPSELLYFCSGRTEHAHVQITAEPGVAEQFKAAVKPL